MQLKSWKVKVLAVGGGKYGRSQKVGRMHDSSVVRRQGVGGGGCAFQLWMQSRSGQW